MTTARLLSLLWLVGWSVAWAVAGLVSLWPLMFSPMLFDAPGSETNAALWLVIGSLAGFPVVCGAAVVAGCILWWVRRYAWSAAVMLLPVLPLVVFGIALTAAFRTPV